MKLSKWFFLIGLLGLAPLQASSQDSNVRDDVRCLIVGARLISLSDATQKSSGMMLTIYYFGRLDAHIPRLDIEGLILKEARAMAQEDYEVEAKRCGNTLMAKGQELSRIGEDLTNASKEKQP